MAANLNNEKQVVQRQKPDIFNPPFREDSTPFSTGLKELFDKSIEKQLAASDAERQNFAKQNEAQLSSLTQSTRDTTTQNRKEQGLLTRIVVGVASIFGIARSTPSATLQTTGKDQINGAAGMHDGKQRSVDLTKAKTSLDNGYMHDGSIANIHDSKELYSAAIKSTSLDHTLEEKLVQNPKIPSGQDSSEEMVLRDNTSSKSMRPEVALKIEQNRETHKTFEKKELQQEQKAPSLPKVSIGITTNEEGHVDGINAFLSAQMPAAAIKNGYSKKQLLDRKIGTSKKAATDIGKRKGRIMRVSG